MNDVNIQVIARMHSDFATKFGIPRQSGLVEELRSTIVFEPEFRNADALRGMDGFSHLWLIWQFSEAVRSGWSPTVRPPRLGGNTRMGVFATRSPFRPNNLGLSCVPFLTSNPISPMPIATAMHWAASPAAQKANFWRYPFLLHCWKSCLRTNEMRLLAFWPMIPDPAIKKMPIGSTALHLLALTSALLWKAKF